MTRIELIRIARTWLGVPFAHQGRNRAGVDCGGLLVAVADEAGLNITPPAVYSQSPDPSVIDTTLMINATRIPLDQIQPGDILRFSFAGEPRHVGLATDIGVIHAWQKPGKVVEHRLDAVWRNRLREAWTPNGVEA
jgi:cell wall-associated NlpC family hydrolase